MMPDVRALLAKQVLPQVFGALGDAGIVVSINILRAVNTSDGYGNEIEGDYEPINSTPIRAAQLPDKNGAFRALNGGEFGTDKFKVPMYWEGDHIDLKPTDKIEVLSDAVIPETKTYMVKEPRNLGVIWEVITTIDRND